MERTSCNVFFNLNLSPVVFSPANEIIETNYISITGQNPLYIGIIVPYGGYIQITNSFEEYNIVGRPLGGTTTVFSISHNVTAKIKIVGDMQFYTQPVSTNSLTLDNNAPT